MKATKALLNKMVEVTWRDPASGRTPMRDAPKGRAAMATWRERGLVDDITDGVLRLVHSAGIEPSGQEVDEIMWTAIAEELIEKLVIYEPMKEESSDRGNGS